MMYNPFLVENYCIVTTAQKSTWYCIMEILFVKSNTATA